VSRLVAEANLVRDGADPELAEAARHDPRCEAERAARAQLDELKRTRKAGLIPMVIQPAAAAVARSA